MSAAPPAVVFVVSHLQPTLGMERAVLELAGLLREHAAVSIVSLGESGPVDLPFDVPHLVLGLKRTGWRRAMELRRIRRYARTADPAAVYICVGVWASIPWLFAAPRLARRTLVWEHSLGREQLRSSRILRARAAVAGLLFPTAAGVVCVSEPLARDVAALNRRIRTTAIENPVPVIDPTTFAARLDRSPGGGCRLLAVGSLTRTKNHQLALRVLATLPATYTLRIAGDGPQRARLEQLIDELALHGRVELLGRVAPAAVAALYRDCDVLVHPALGETFGYVYFEAADWGVPVVSTAHRVAAEFIPTLVPGELVEPEVQHMAAAIAGLPSTPSRELVLRARNARAARFDSARITDLWRRVIQDIDDAGTAGRGLGVFAPAPSGLHGLNRGTAA